MLFIHITQLFYTQVCLISKDFVVEEILSLVNNYQHLIITISSVIFR